MELVTLDQLEGKLVMWASEGYMRATCGLRGLKDIVLISFALVWVIFAVVVLWKTP